MQFVETTNYFETWLESATSSARSWWERCKAAADNRAAQGGPMLEQMWNEYEALRACGGGEFDPNEFHMDEDVLVDGINEEIIARQTFDECLTSELDQMLHNKTYDAARALSARVVASMN